MKDWVADYKAFTIWIENRKYFVTGPGLPDKGRAFLDRNKAVEFAKKQSRGDEMAPDHYLVHGDQLTEAREQLKKNVARLDSVAEKGFDPAARGDAAQFKTNEEYAAAQMIEKAKKVVADPKASAAEKEKAKNYLSSKRGDAHEQEKKNYDWAKAQWRAGKMSNDDFAKIRIAYEKLTGRTDTEARG